MAAYHLSPRIARFAMFVSVFLVCGGIAAGQVPANWTGGGGDSSYGNPANWDIGAVPVNTGTVTYSVVIPDGATVWFDVDGLNEVTDLQLGNGSTMQVNPGKSLTVLDDASIYGYVTTDAGTFLAEAPAAMFPGNKAQLRATGGGTIACAAPTYSSHGLNSGGSAYTLFYVNGTGSTLDLGGLRTLDLAFNDGSGWVTTQKIEAVSNGHIDFSTVETLYGPARGEDQVIITVNTGGSVDLSSLTSIPSGYNITFDLDVDSFDLPSLGSTVNTIFSLAADTDLNLPSLHTVSGGRYTVGAGAVATATALTNADGLTIDVQAGGTFDAPNLTTFTNGVLTLAAGRTLNLPQFTDFDNSRVTITNGETLTVSAENYACTNLRSAGATYVLFEVSGESGDKGTPSLLDMSSVLTFNGAYDDASGWAAAHQVFVSDGGRIDLSGLQTLLGPARGEDWQEWYISSGGEVDFSSLKSISSVGTTKFEVTLESFDLPSLESATGASFVLNGTASEMAVLNDVTNTSFSASAGATVSLPALGSHDGGSYTVADGCSVSAPNLLSAEGVTLTVEEGGTFQAGQLTSFTRGYFHRHAGQTLDLPAFVNADDSRFKVTNGETLTVSAENYACTNLRSGGATYVLFEVSGESTEKGTPSLLDMSSVLTFNGAYDDASGWAAAHQVFVSDGGRIDLSGLQTLLGPARGEDWQEWYISSGGSVDFSGLKSISSVGTTKFEVTLESFDLPSLESATGASFVLNGAASEMAVLNDVTNTSFSVSAGAAVSLPVLGSHDGGSYTVADGCSVSAPNLLSAEGVTLTVEEGGTFEAGRLTSFTGGYFHRHAGQTLDLPAFVNVDNSRLKVTNGETLTVSAENYSCTNLRGAGATYVLFEVSGESAEKGTPSRRDEPVFSRT